MDRSSSFLHKLFGLDGKTVLVTGAGGGIGQVFALALAQAGATVGVHDVSHERLAGVQRAIEAVGGQALPLTGDLSDVAVCERLIGEAQAGLGRLDVLINCAGMNRRKPIADVSPTDFDLIVAVNLRSIFFLSQAAQRVMRDQGGGKIINIGSLTSHIGLGAVSVYGITKAAVAQLTKTMAVEWAQDNIQVNCLAPGFMLTPLSQTLWEDAYKSAWMRERIPTRRPGQPDELVGVVLLLASGASSYVSGQTIAVDGGFLAGGSWERDAT